jgi:exodeoxyribonuclease V beta subunit
MCQQILVVTFTNAATAELRERIRSRIVDVLAYLQRAATASDPFVAQLLAAVENNTGVDRQPACSPASKRRCTPSTKPRCSRFTASASVRCRIHRLPPACRSSLELLHDDQPLRLEAVSDFWRRQVASAAISPALADYLLQQRQDSPERLGAAARAPACQAAFARDLARRNGECSAARSTLAGLLHFQACTSTLGRATAPARPRRC